MREFKLSDMVRGWFVGDFDPAVLHTTAFEVGVKRHAADTAEGAHFHQVATEITVLVEGSATINGKLYQAGDIIVVEPGEIAEFKAVTDVTTVVVKMPSVLGDKYPAPQPPTGTGGR